MPAPLQAFQQAIVAVRPDLAGGKMSLLTEGWDSTAVEALGQWIFKFPKTEAAAGRLRRESRLLGLLRQRVEMPLPDMRLHQTPRLFSEHRKIDGEKIETPQYDGLDENQRQAMAVRLAEFYATLHAIPLEEAHGVGAEPIGAGKSAAETAARAREVLPPALLGFSDRVLAAWTALPVDETVLGYFDGHGWNMAFDHRKGVLNGLYDFADAGLGPLHQDFSLGNFISPDLTLRIIDRYEMLTGHIIDRRRVMLLTAVQRLAELGATASLRPPGWFVGNVVAWHDFLMSRPDLRL